MLAAVLLGCPADPANKISGWPPTSPSWPLVDTHAPAAPESDTAEAMAVVDTETAEDDVLAATPCRALIDLACELYTEHSDNCGEARSRPPDDRDPDTRARCIELFERFTTEERDKRGSPCRRYARARCASDGPQTRACQAARKAIGRLVSKRDKLACLGDLLMLEVRTLRRIR